MRSAPYDLRAGSAGAAATDALFASALQRSDEPSARQVEQAVAAAIRALGELGCAARVAQAYGEDPDTAVSRMRWARAMVAGAFGAPPSAPAGELRAGRCTIPLALAGLGREPARQSSAQRPVGAWGETGISPR